jgi:hypothetical protein
MSENNDPFSGAPDSVAVEVTIPADFYAELAGAVASDDDLPEALIEVDELIALIVQEAWAEADENTPWLQRVWAQIESHKTQ